MQTHLDQLEAKAIHVLREVVAELERPVLPEMLAFLEQMTRPLVASQGSRLEVFAHPRAGEPAAEPLRLGTLRCCAILETDAVLLAAGAAATRARSSSSTRRATRRSEPA